MKKIKKLLTSCIAIGILTNTFPINTFATELPSINKNSTSTLLLGNSIEESLAKKTYWSKSSDGTWINSNKNILFKNLYGENGKDVVITLTGNNPLSDTYVLNLLSEMVNYNESQYSFITLSYLMSKGSQTIVDGSRKINVHYDEETSPIITLTFYEYKYEPNYILPSLDNSKIISILEKSLASKVISIDTIGYGNTSSPLAFQIVEDNHIEVATLFNSLQDNSSSILSSKKIINEENTTIELTISKDNAHLLSNPVKDSIVIQLSIDNSYSNALSIANHFLESISSPVIDDDKFENSFDDEDLVIKPDDNISDVIPPVEDDDGNNIEDTPSINDEINKDEENNNTGNTPDVDKSENSFDDEDLVIKPDDNINDVDIVIPIGLQHINSIVLSAMNEGIINFNNTGNGSKNSPLEYILLDTDLNIIKNLFTNLKRNAEDITIFIKDEYTILRFKLKNTYSKLSRYKEFYTDYSYFDIKIHNSSTSLLDLVNEFFSIDSTDTSSITDDLSETEDTISKQNIEVSEINNTNSNDILRLPLTGTTLNMCTPHILGLLTSLLGILLLKKSKKSTY